MKTLIATVLILGAPHAHAALTCDELFHQRIVTNQESELRHVIAELQSILTTTQGPDADKEVDRVLKGDVHATLVDITNQMNADDRLIDDLLQGRRTLKNTRTLEEFKISLERYRALKTGEQKMSSVIGRLFPEREKRREEEIRSAIPRQSALLQSVRAETERDIELMKEIRASTESHLAALKNRLALLKTLETHLEEIVPGQSVFEQALLTRMRYEILNQIRDLSDMSLTAQASITSLGLVIDQSRAIKDGIEKELNVVLPRVAVVTKTPSLISNLQAGAKAAALIRPTANQGALEAYGSPQDFARLRSIVLDSKDDQLGLSALSSLLKRQTTELPDALLAAFKTKNATSYLLRFLTDAKATTWTLSMNGVHSSVLESIVRAKSPSPDLMAALEGYSKVHEFDSSQIEWLAKAFLDKKLPKVQRVLAVSILMDHPQAHVIDTISSSLATETDSDLVGQVKAKIESAKSTASAHHELVASLDRNIERANAAEATAKLDENLKRLTSLEKNFRAYVRRAVADFETPTFVDHVVRGHLASDWQKVLRENPHAQRANTIKHMAAALMLEKKSSFHTQDTTLDHLSVAAKLTAIAHELGGDAEPATLSEIRRNIRPYKDNSRLGAMVLWLDLATKTPVDGLREVLDQKISEAEPGDYQTILLAKRLELDLTLGADALTEPYRERFDQIFTELSSKKASSIDRTILRIVAKKELLSASPLTDGEVKAFDALTRDDETLSLNDALRWADAWKRRPALHRKLDLNSSLHHELMAILNGDAAVFSLSQTMKYQWWSYESNRAVQIQILDYLKEHYGMVPKNT